VVAPGIELTSEPGSGQVTVHVSGAVVAPGLVEIAEGGRIADAIAAAGGVLPGADLEGVNLAAAVREGEQVVIPSADGGGPLGPAAVTDTGVRVNTASESELQQLTGVGPVLAARIVEHREANGPFESPEDLLDVPGIGEATLAEMRDDLVVP